jgi:hypothetical protein
VILQSDIDISFRRFSSGFSMWCVLSLFIFPRDMATTWSVSVSLARCFVSAGDQPRPGRAPAVQPARSLGRPRAAEARSKGG